MNKTFPSNQTASQDAPRTQHIMQGSLFATGEDNVVLTTILGSCVATCLFDPMSRLGGMNHFLLPDGGAGDTGNNRYGVHAMELLINDLIKKGAQKNRMIAKVFGGADMIGNDRAVGIRNVEFALAFLKDEGVPCASQSVGGKQARRVRFWPQTGQARLKFIENDQRLFQASKPAPKPEFAAGDVDLF